MKSITTHQKTNPSTGSIQSAGSGGISIASPNHTGLPDVLKSGVESLSGFSLDDVRVHYNSPKPAQLQALAYTQGTNIHVAPGQERHLPHEAWHVVQQKQGRVGPTIAIKKTAINDDHTLEQEASEMGGKALRLNSSNPVVTPGTAQTTTRALRTAGPQIIQRITHDNPASAYIAMDHWGYLNLGNDGDKIYTDSMSTCVTIAIYNDAHHALIAHFGSSSLTTDPIADVTEGITTIDAAITQLGGNWAGWVFTGKKGHQISEKRIQIIKKKFAFLERTGPYEGVTLKRTGSKIVPQWKAISVTMKYDMAW